jgi:hypothetical protein
LGHLFENRYKSVLCQEEQYFLTLVRSIHLRQLRIRNSGKTVGAIINEECARTGLSANELAPGSRRNNVSQARAAIAFRCVRELDTPVAEIARYVGVNTSSVSRAIARMEEGDKP